MRRWLVVACLLTWVGSVGAQGTAEDYDRAAKLHGRTRDKVHRTRIQPHWFDDNQRFWYRVDLGGGTREYVLVEVAAGTRKAAFDAPKLAASLSAATGQKVDATRLSLDQLAFESDARVATFQALGKRWRLDRTAGTLTEVPTKAKPAEKPQKTSPPQPVVFQADAPRPTARLRDHNVYLRDPKSGEEKALTKDGTREDGYAGALHWSPDRKYLVVFRTRAGQRRQIHFIESSPPSGVQPKLHSFRYDKPGDSIDVSKPHLFDVGTGKEIPIADDLFRTPWSITDLRWEADSSRFTFVYNQRGHQVLRVVAVDAATGKASALVDEQSKTFLDYAHKQYLHWLDATRELIWMSERDGWNHLYLYDAKTGQVKHQITRGEWVVRRVERVDAEKRQLWLRVSGIHPGQDPYHIHFARINFDGTGLVLLTEGDGTHQISHSPDRKYLIDTWSRVDQPPVIELRRADDGKLVCVLEKADAAELLGTGVKLPERFVAPGRDGKTPIWGVIHRPTNFDPNRRYPVIEYIYAGPHGSFVPKEFRDFHWVQTMAELGFIVVQIDGMGTSHRSKAFHDVCWKNLGDSGFPDRILWMQAAAKKYPYLDLTRVGIYGGSAGGQSSTRAVFAHGDFYKVAVSDCGCHDNRVDKIWWNELWMGWPIGPHYAAQSNANLENAKKLTGKLLLIVGEMDRNVDPASTLQVVNALVKANRDFDLLIIPGAGHGAAESPYGQRRRQDFFVRHLHGKEPRWAGK
ncbi:MAG: prolyl oligopeptidase family serine peptidase [Gemmataceae bacterium]